MSSTIPVEVQNTPIPGSDMVYYKARQKVKSMVDKIPDFVKLGTWDLGCTPKDWKQDMDWVKRIYNDLAPMLADYKKLNPDIIKKYTSRYNERFSSSQKHIGKSVFEVAYLPRAQRLSSRYANWKSAGSPDFCGKARDGKTILILYAIYQPLRSRLV